MKMRTVRLLCILSLAGALAAEPKVIASRVFFLYTEYGEKVIAAIRNLSVSVGGYTKFFADRKITIYVPASAVGEVKKTLKRFGDILDERLLRRDVSERIMLLETRLKSKQAHAAKLESIFKDAGFRQTLDVERAVTGVISEIEKIKGAINYLRKRSSMLDVTVFLNINKRMTGRKYGMSDWRWIRGLGVERL